MVTFIGHIQWYVIVYWSPVEATSPVISTSDGDVAVFWINVALGGKALGRLHHFGFQTLLKALEAT